MEDIRIYMDGTEGAYHKGETHPFGVLAGALLLGIGAFWILQGGWFLLKYGAAFSDAAGALQVDFAAASTCWVLASLRLLQGLACGYVGLLAWDGRRAFLHWLWILGPLYLWYWGGWFLAVDPEFRAQELGLSQIATYPVAFVVALSMVAVAGTLVGSFATTWAFRPSAKDFHPAILATIFAVGLGGLYLYLEPVSGPVRSTGMLYGISPLDHARAELGVLKLVAMGLDELRCHEIMDELAEGLDRLEASGRKVMYSAYDTRPGGERLLRMLRQSAGVSIDPACPAGGWYRVVDPSGTWRCSVHGDRVPPEDRKVGPMEEDDEGGEFDDFGSDL